MTRAARKISDDEPEARGTAPAWRGLPLDWRGSTLTWRGLAAVFAVAFLVRVVVATELSKTALYQSPQLDALEFLRWAQDLAAGRFEFPPYPTHGPVYPAFLAVLLKLFDGSLAAVRWVQAALGAGSCVLVAVLAGRLGGRWSGVLGGLLLALYGPLVFVDTALWEEGVYFALLLAGLWLLTGPWRNGLAAAAAGLTLGLAVLVRPTALVLLPLWLLAVVLPPWSSSAEPWRRRILAPALVTLAVAVLVVPVVVHVSRANGTFLLVRGFGSINLYIGNDPAGGGAQNARLGGDWDRLESAPLREGLGMPDLEGYYTGLTLERIRHDPWGFVSVLLSKAVWLVQAEEVRDNHSYYFFQERSRLLAWLPGFGLLGPLALCGLVTAWRGRPRPWLLTGYLVLMAGTVVIALMGMRYRMPLIPVLAVFAGLGAARLWELARRRTWRPLAALGALVLVAAVLVHLRHHPASHNPAEEWALTGSSLEQLGRLDEAEEAFRKATEADPGSALGWDGLGRIAVHRGDLVKARESFERAVRADPGFRRSHFHLGQVLRHAGEADAAIAEYEAAVAIGPRYLVAWQALAPLYMERQRPGDAAAAWDAILRITPDDVDALLARARLAGAAHEASAGVGLARRATELAPRRDEAWLLLGFLALDAGETELASTAADHTLDLQGPSSPQGLFLRASVERARGDGGAALATLQELLLQQPRMTPALRLYLRTAEELGRRAEAEEFLRRLQAGL